MNQHILFETMYMTASGPDRGKRTYAAPALRVVSPQFESNFVTSNTEPIDDDGQEHGWD